MAVVGVVLVFLIIAFVLSACMGLLADFISFLLNPKAILAVIVVIVIVMMLLGN